MMLKKILEQYTTKSNSKDVRVYSLSKAFGCPGALM